MYQFFSYLIYLFDCDNVNQYIRIYKKKKIKIIYNIQINIYDEFDYYI